MTTEIPHVETVVLPDSLRVESRAARAVKGRASRSNGGRARAGSRNGKVRSSQEQRPQKK